MAYLVMIEGRTPGARFELRAERATIGRSRANALVVDDPRASGTHVEIVVDRGRHLLRDLHSSNGTFVNGARLHGEHALGLEDRVRVGSTTFVYRPDIVGSATTPRPIQGLPTAVLRDRRSAPSGSSSGRWRRPSGAAYTPAPRPRDGAPSRDTMQTLDIPLAEVLEHGAEQAGAEQARAAAAAAPARSTRTVVALPGEATAADELPAAAEATDAGALAGGAPGAGPTAAPGESTHADEVQAWPGACAAAGDDLRALSWPVAAALTQLEDAIERREPDRALGLVAELRHLLAREAAADERTPRPTIHAA